MDEVPHSFLSVWLWTLFPLRQFTLLRHCGDDFRHSPYCWRLRLPVKHPTHPVQPISSQRSLPQKPLTMLWNFLRSWRRCILHPSSFVVEMLKCWSRHSCRACGMFYKLCKACYALYLLPKYLLMIMAMLLFWLKTSLGRFPKTFLSNKRNQWA